MPTLAHLSNASVGQASGMNESNGSSLPLQNPGVGGATDGRRSWHTENDDYPLRAQVVQSIFQLFQKRRSNVTAEWQQRLPDFIRKLEEALYRHASTKEEYRDPQTLETRLQYIARQMTRANQPSDQITR